jgi:predicted pyridoxine 5'-phosphate oxidase superfamily flavin-nucleotide-binding protein
MSDQALLDVAAPWHEGERTLQRSVGLVERMDDIGRRVIRSTLPEQHRAFYPLLPFIVMGTVDAGGDVWATIRAGVPGFIQSPDPRHLDIRSRRDPADPAEAGLNDGDAVGLLGIELTSRRRNRANGTVRRRDAAGFTVEVAQTFGNCPQYIQKRDVMFTRDPFKLSTDDVSRQNTLDDRARSIIKSADTFFVASYDDEDGIRHVDVSHRGGNTGFVRVGEDGVLTIPDFSGNRFFNTLGNFLVNPKAGLVFVDFSTGDLLQMTGDTEVMLESPDIAAFEGAERLWRFTPRRVIFRPRGLPMKWSFEPGGWSPRSLETGNWADAERRIEAARR